MVFFNYNLALVWFISDHVRPLCYKLVLSFSKRISEQEHVLEFTVPNQYYNDRVP